MTYDEAMKVLAILKGAYPNSYRGVTVEEAKLTASVWAAQFANMPVKIVLIAVNKLISTSTFPPSIKEVKDKINGLYYECENLLQAHRYATVGAPTHDGERFIYGDPLSDDVIKQLNEIIAIVDPFRGNNTEPKLDDILKNSNAYLLGIGAPQNRTE